MSFGEHKPLSRILLLGAGFSQPAGIPTINKMTEEFFKDPTKALKENEKNLAAEFLTSFTADRLKILEKVAGERFQRSDLEYMMSLLRELENESDLKYFESRYPSLTELLGSSEVSLQEKLILIRSYRTVIQNYIRNACENIASIQYLYGLDGLIQTEPLNIFTLNYDGIIENYCEQQHIEYQDGYNPYWNPNVFNEKSKINLFKLHGSLYWIRTKSAKVVKVPVQGIDMLSMKYIDSTPISEMMLYPELQKDKELEVYTWLNRRFKDELNKSNLCIIIGYSFRDRDVKNSILESLNSNSNLWLIIVDPNASKLKQDIVSDNEHLKERIVVMDIGVEQALGGRKLNTILEPIEAGRSAEENADDMQKNSMDRLDHFWRIAIYNYQRINHDDKVKVIVEKLAELSITEPGDYFPNIIEAIVWDRSLPYTLDYYAKQNQPKYEIWKDIFVKASMYFEYVYFEQKPELKGHNPIDRSQLPSRVKSHQSLPEDSFGKSKETITKALQKITDESLKQKIDKFIQTIDLMDHKEYSNPEKTSYTRIQPQEFLEKYKKADLGLYRWATEIANSLKF